MNSPAEAAGILPGSAYLVKLAQDGSITSVTELCTVEEFKMFVATIYSETSFNHDETLAIASVIQNRLDERGGNYEKVFRVSQFNGMGTDNYDYGKKNIESNATSIRLCRAAAVNAISHGRDLSQGSYFWMGGHEYLRNKHFYYRVLIQHYDTREAMELTKRSAPMTAPVFMPVVRLGETIFFKYNPNSPEYGHMTF